MSAQKQHGKIGQFAATAICGNDILSSVLYVSGIAIMFAGIYAPFVFILIALVLYFYKAVYTEVVEALPINGGAYNCLLNGTSKTIAAIAGVTTFLSYVATAVISAKTAVAYLNTIIPEPIILVTIIVLFIFAMLVISGLKDSAKAATIIFTFHIISLCAFVGLGIYYLLTSHNLFFMANFKETATLALKHNGISTMIYFAFAASLLGVTGFESSANFVEEQKKGVFRKTLRNMLIVVAIFNPLVSMIILGAMPYAGIVAAKDFVLADTARIIGGSWFQTIIVIDAFLVLAGAVLTAYVGVSGLIYRMASDSCLPGFLTKKNSRGAFPIIILSFFVLCSSILLITKGNLMSLAGVYTIAFLTVMSLFALGNLILKETRPDLKRTYRAPVVLVVLAFLSTVFGVFGNIRIDPNNLRFFEIYFIPSLLLILGYIYQDYIIEYISRFTKGNTLLHRYLGKYHSDLLSGRFVVFVHHSHRLYHALEYIEKNEHGHEIILVFCMNGDKKADDHNFREIKHLVKCLQAGGVFPHFKIELHMKTYHFSPAAVARVAKEFQIHTNRIMIGSIHDFHRFDYNQLSGARIIY